MSELDVEFVDAIPEVLADDVLYVCIAFATAVHRCRCGCGGEVVTPFTPTDWTLIYDGDTVSLDPSISNSSSDCGAHYFIERSATRWCRMLSPVESADRQRRDRQAKSKYFDAPVDVETPGGSGQRDLWRRFLAWLRRLPERRRAASGESQEKCT